MVRAFETPQGPRLVTRVTRLVTGDKAIQGKVGTAKTVLTVDRKLKSQEIVLKEIAK